MDTTLTRAEIPTRDLADRDDVYALLTAFYGRALVDDLLTDAFSDIRARGLESHLPVMCDFWETMLFRAKLYRGSALAPHQHVHAEHPLTDRQACPCHLHVTCEVEPAALGEAAPAQQPELALAEQRVLGVERRGRHANGFTLVSMVFVLVVLALLGGALARIAMRQQLGSAADLEHARATQAARAGLEWGAFQVLRTPAPPAAAPACFGRTSFALAAFAGFTITVDCTRSDAVDGATAMSFYTLVANACNAASSGACPTTAAQPQPTYVERQLSWTVAR